MAKQLNVNMNFTADVSAAKRNIETLKQSLSTIGAINIGSGANDNLQKAVTSAKELQTHLTKAFNVKTGNLDLSKLQISLEKSNLSLKQLSSNLLGAGKNGETAFLSMHRALASANLSLNKTQGLLGQLGTTFLNTLRWQATSTAIHEIAGAINSAVRYAEDLNNSLNSIRIVTGQSTEQMANFAQYCNESAQALNTSTLAMSKAALIYFQQGLSTDEVKERTETTIKMANVTGEAAQQVSSYMTAIWNNFDDGSESLEHFGDVLAALGATTASSSKEIAEGLQQFASIGQTVGLSYDYATSALATIVANTRESANTVGTSLKTIFSRIQGLSLGETAEDGVNLNKYSEALSKIGVEVLDQQGNLKDLDIILDDLASKWDGLTRAQQTATAQTVAGTRQYTRLMALMNNWDDMEMNLGTAENADGTLQEQQDIFAESWEGALKRIKAAWEEVYGDLIDDEFVINLMNKFADLINIIEKLIKGLGGMKTIILMISTLLMNKFQANITTALDSAITKIGHLKQGLGAGIKGFKDWGKEADNASKNVDKLFNGRIIQRFNRGLEGAKKKMGEFSLSQQSKDQIIGMENSEVVKKGDGAFKTGYKSLLDNYKTMDKMNALYKNMTSEERKLIELQQEQKIKIDETVVSEYQKLDIIKKELQGYQNQAAILQKSSGFEKLGQGMLAKEKLELEEKELEILERIVQEYYEIELVDGGIIGSEQDLLFLRQSLLENVALLAEFEQLMLQAKELGYESEEAQYNFAKENLSVENDYIQKLYDEETEETKKLEKIREELRIQKEINKAVGNRTNTVNGAEKTGIKAAKSRTDIFIGESKSKEINGNINKSLDDIKARSESVAASLSRASGTAMQLGMSISMVSSAIKTLKDDEASFSDKLTSGLMAFSFSLPLILQGYQGIVGFVDKINKLKTASNFLDEEGLVAAELKEITEGNITREQKLQKIQKTFGVELEQAELILNTAELGIEKGTTKEIIKQLVLKNKMLIAMTKFLAVAGLVAVVFLEIYAAVTAEERALKRVNDELKRSKEEAANAKKEFNELGETLKHFQDAKKDINDLIEGTTEWKEAVASLNGEVLELLEKYPELVNYLEKDSNGILSISMEGQKKAFEERYKAVVMTSINQLSSAVNVKEAENNKIISDYVKKYNLKLGPGNTKEGPPTYNLNDKKYINEIYEDYKRNGVNAINNNNNIDEVLKSSLLPFENSSEKLADTIDKAKIEMINVCQQMKINEETQKTLNRQLADQTLTFGMKGYENNPFQIQLQDYLTKARNQGPNADSEALRKAYADVTWLDKREVAAIYAKNNNLSSTDYDVVGDKIQFKDGSEAVDIGDYKMGALAQEYAAMYSGASTEGYGNQLASVAKKMSDGFITEFKDAGMKDSEMDEISDVIVNMMSGDKETYMNALYDLSEEQVEFLKENIGDVRNKASKVYENLTDEEKEALKEFGIHTVDEFSHYFEEAMDEYSPEEAEMRFFKKLRDGAKDIGDKYKVDEDAVYGFSKVIQGNTEDVKDNAEAVLDLTEKLVRYGENFGSLVDAFEKNEGLLNEFEITGDSSSWEVQKAFAEIGQAWEDMTGTKVSNDFVEKNYEDLKKLANGATDVFEDLQAEAAKDFVLNLDIKSEGQDALNGLLDSLDDATKDEYEFKFKELNPKELENAIQEGVNYVNEATDLDGLGGMKESYLDTLNEMLSAGEITQEQVNTALGNIGWKGKFDTIGYNDIKTDHRIEWTEGEKAGTTEAWSEIVREPVMGLVGVSESRNIKDNDLNTNMKPTTRQFDSGKRGRSAKKQSRNNVKKDDVSERYHVINKSLDRNAQALERLHKAEEKTWGAKKLKLYDKELKNINKTLDLNKKKLDQSRKYTQYDLNELKNAGLTLGNKDLKNDGNLTGAAYDKITNDWMKQLNDANNAIVNFKATIGENNLTEPQQQQLDELQETYDDVKYKIDQQKEALANYEQSVEDVKAQIQSWMDTYDEMLAKSYEKIEYQMEIKATLNENSLKQIDYYIGKYSDGIYKNIEALGGLNYNLEKNGVISSSGDSYYIQQLMKARKSMKLYGDENLSSEKFEWTDTTGKTQKTKSYFTTLQEMKDAGAITQADYVEGLQKGYEESISSLQNYIDATQQLHDYWQQGIDEYTQYFDKLNNNFEHSSAVLDHFKNILELTGNNSSEIMSNVYATRTDTALKQFQASKKEYDTLKDAYDDLKNRTEAGKKAITKIEVDKETEKSISKEEAEVAEKLIADSMGSLQDLEKQMYADFESYVQALTDETTYYIENQMNALEDALTEMVGGFEEILNRMNMSSTYSSEYLTETNKLYETNKLLRTLQKDMNNSDNKAAKQKYAAYMSELKQLQSKDKLSNLELDIAQKKYDLLKAQIALEDSQNAKQTVRLMRDNEGNYGYVYTMSEEVVTEAEQAVEDAENALYNVELEAANNYGQKIIQTEKEAQEKMSELYQNYIDGTYGAYGSAEALAAYNEAKDNAIETYGELLGSYTDLYAIATTDDARVVNDAWITAYDDIIEKSYNWKDLMIATSNSVSTVMLKNTKLISDAMEDIVNQGLVDEIGKNNETVAQAIISALDEGGEMANLLEAIKDTTTGYIAQRDAIDNTVAAMEDLIHTYEQLIAAEAKDTSSRTNFNKLMRYTNDIYFEGNNKGKGLDSVNGLSYIKGLENDSKVMKDILEKINGDIVSINESTTEALLGYMADNRHGYWGLKENGQVVYKLVNSQDQPSESDVQKWVDEKKGAIKWATSFDTGGYTGRWGADGRLAMLHQKELVLNADDTENMLSAIDIVRDIVKTINLNNLQNSLSVYNSNISVPTMGQTLEQSVSINAEFPNATNHTEIEQAFENLKNKALQYASRNR